MTIEIKEFDSKARLEHAIKCWREQYSTSVIHTPDRRFADGTLIKDVSEKIDALNTNVHNHLDFDRIVGNSSWTRLACSGCGDIANQHVIFSNHTPCADDGQDDVVEICHDCVNQLSESIK